MFKRIFSYELNSWLYKPSIYIFCFLIFGGTAMLVALTGGAFDSNTASVSSLKYINAPSGILAIVVSMTVFAMLLFTIICGDSIYKDIKTGAFQVMYSYPYSKPAYFFGKFLSAFFICLVLILFIALGAAFGFIIPGVNKDMIGPHSITPYIQTYLIYLIPNTFLFCAIVFAIVTYTRSILAGFVAMIAIYVLSGVLDSALMQREYFEFASMMDPFGSQADAYYTKYYTVDEYNNAPIPFKGYIIYNRLLWVGIGLAVLLWSYVTFSFEVVPSRWSLFSRQNKPIKSIAHRSIHTSDLDLPKVSRHYGIAQVFTSAWLLSKIDLAFILRGGAFIVISIIGLLILGTSLAFTGEFIGTKTYPTTANMLLFSRITFRMFIVLLTFIYTGTIINKRTDNNIYQLEDVSPTKNLSFLLSKFISISLMQVVLLVLPILAAVIYQITQSYYNFEPGLYLFDTYVLRFISLIPWTLLAIFIFSLIPNFYIGLIVTLIVAIGVNFLPQLGIEKSLFRYNEGPTPIYSDMTGYSLNMSKFFIYRFYWILGGMFLALIGLIFWRRGVKVPFKSRIPQTLQSASGGLKSASIFFLSAFLLLGGFIYYSTFVTHTVYSSKEREKQRVEFEKNYKYLSELAQPRIIDVNLNVDLYPIEKNLSASGYYLIKNKSDQTIDSVVINHGYLLDELSFDQPAKLLLQDSVMDIRIYSLDSGMAPGDSIKMSFTLRNEENTLFRSNAPVLNNGTFINNSIFPTIGYNDAFELTDNKVRLKYDLPERERMAEPTDSTALQNTYLSNCADWISFEIIIGTVPEQIAMAPGQLQREWEENGRRYFHYRMDQPMLNFYNISSAEYEVIKDIWQDVELSIYYHKGHDYNLDRMMKALKDGFEYYTTEYSPYQFKQLRILEFPSGGFAQSFANTVPFAENAGFTAQVDDSDEGGVDYAYTVTAHELAHQWWAHQVIGADVKGATMLSESLSEYSALKVLERRYGSDKMRQFLKDALDKYLLSRQMENSKELPLAYNETQQYIHYQKGSLIFYALSDLIGEKTLNQVLASYIDQVAFQEPPYTTSLELLALLKAATPDSLRYFLEDNFEHITLYNNRVKSAEYIVNDDGSYDVDISAQVIKYRTDERGKQSYKNYAGDMLEITEEGAKRSTKSYPLQDYIDIAVFGSEEVDGVIKEKVLYLQKHKFIEINNKLNITVDEMPIEVGIDPYNKLIDRDSNDNRKKCVVVE